MIQTMFNWFNQLSQLAHNSCTILPSPWSDPLAPPWSRPMRWVGSEFHLPNRLVWPGDPTLSILGTWTHVWSSSPEMVQVGNFAKLESNLSWHVLQKHLTLYLIILYFHINCMAFPHETGGPRTSLWSVLGIFQLSFYKSSQTTKWQNDTKCILYVPQLGFFCYVCFPLHGNQKQPIAMIKIPQFFQLKNFPSSLRSWTTFQSWPTDQQHDPTAADEPRFPSTSVLHVLVYKLQMCFLFV